MASDAEIDKLYMDFAKRVAKMSYCERKKVGAVIANGPDILAYGFNGTLPGDINCCEDDEGLTRDDVIHAEENALLKLAEGKGGASGSTLYVTCGPCNHCSAMFIKTKIKRVVYLEIYSHHDEFVKKMRDKGIIVESFAETQIDMSSDSWADSARWQNPNNAMNYLGYTDDDIQRIQDRLDAEKPQFEPILEKRYNGDGTVTFRHGDKEIFVGNGLDAFEFKYEMKEDNEQRTIIG